MFSTVDFNSAISKSQLAFDLEIRSGISDSMRHHNGSKTIPFIISFGLTELMIIQFRSIKLRVD